MSPSPPPKTTPLMPEPYTAAPPTATRIEELALGEILCFADVREFELSRQGETQVWIGLVLATGEVVRFDLSTRDRVPLVVTYDVQPR
jgi:hypothetical protein